MTVVFLVRLYLKRRGRSVTFEMAEYQMGQEMTTQPPISQNNEADQSSSPNSNRKPLNDKGGYGEFIDEVWTRYLLICAFGSDKNYHIHYHITLNQNKIEMNALSPTDKFSHRRTLSKRRCLKDLETKNLVPLFEHSEERLPEDMSSIIKGPYVCKMLKDRSHGHL